MNLFAVLFFEAQHPIAVAPHFAGYVRRTRVGPDSPTADTFGLVVGRHTGSAYSHVNDKVMKQMLTLRWRETASGIVLIGGVDMNSVQTFKDRWFNKDTDILADAALRHMNNLPPIYTGELCDFRDPAAPYCIGREPIPSAGHSLG
jgi:hypothetical protein